MEEFQQRAQVLIEAIRISVFTGKPLSSNTAETHDQPGDQKAVILDIILLKYLGLNPVIVGGGGSRNA